MKTIYPVMKAVSYCGGLFGSYQRFVGSVIYLVIHFDIPLRYRPF